MIQKILKFFLILLSIVCLIAILLFYSIFIGVERVHLNYETIASEKIPEDMNQLQIAFLSDLHYNAYMDQERLAPMIEKLNNANPDIVIFGGDLFDHPSTYAPSDETKEELKEMLKSIQAPLGKFAVLGDHDLETEETKTMVSELLVDCDFELITNTSLLIRNHTNSSISLTGLDSSVNGTPDTATAFSSLASDHFNLVVTHCPDLAAQSGFPSQSIDLMLAGHSHGGQIYLPLLGPLDLKTGSRKYNHGTYTLNQTMLLHVTNGLGTTDTDLRLFSSPEILIYRLVSIPKEEEEIKTNETTEDATLQESTPEPEANNDTANDTANE